MKLHIRDKGQAAGLRRLFHMCEHNSHGEARGCGSGEEARRRSSGEEGFSLLESLVAIVVFAVVISSVGSSLVMAHRINARSEVLMQEQLKVSRAVESLMSEGILAAADEETLADVVGDLRERFGAEDGYDVGISVKRGELHDVTGAEGTGGEAAGTVVETNSFYEVEIWSKVLSEDVRVHTYIRAVTEEVAGE